MVQRVPDHARRRSHRWAGRGSEHVSGRRRMSRNGVARLLLVRVRVVVVAAVTVVGRREGCSGGERVREWQGRLGGDSVIEQTRWGGGRRRRRRAFGLTANNFDNE